LESISDAWHFSPSLHISLVGGIVVIASLLSYQSILYTYPVNTQDIQLLQETAYAVLAALLTGLCLLLAGITRYLTRCSPSNKATNSPSITVLLSLILGEKRSFRIFIAATILYGLFFAIISSFLVYQPAGRFSNTYGVSVPSILPVICCAQLGQMPQFVVYVTEQFAIFIAPINLILLFVVSWLVGLNVAIAMYSYRNRSNDERTKWLGGLGAVVGIFTACPTCAGYFLLTLFGLAGAVTFALTLSSLQIVFVALGLPMLLVTPITTARSIQNECSISSAKPRNS
jgi:hypothetical protein